jgi:LPXTG-site transpeptidase (sortase) family protein
VADTVLAGPVPGAGASGEPGPAPSAPPAPAQPRPPRGPERPILQAVGVGLLLLAILALGLAGYLYFLSGVQEARSQTLLYTELQNELANQLAPLGPTSPGSPVAVLSIPAVGIRDMVVVQGTSPENMTLGPGHLRDTPMPGQAGVSEIFGRRATFGAPFARLDELRPGDVIVTITGQGRSVYRVAALGASQAVRIEDPDPNRLLLVTAASPVVPSYYVEVDARLVSVTRPGPPVVRVLNAPELALAGDDGALVLTFIWGVALAAVSALGTYAALRWNLWAAYLAAVPLAIAVLWNLYQSLSALLPNVY